MIKKVACFSIFIIIILLNLSITSSKYNFEEKILDANINIEATNHTITFDYNYNIIKNLDDVDGEYIGKRNSLYTIKNGITTFSSTDLDDGYAYTPFEVDLINGQKYKFKVTIDGVIGSFGWMTGNPDLPHDSQEIYLMKNTTVEKENYSSKEYRRMSSTNYIFNSDIDGTYVFRFDVNQKETTHIFKDLWISNIEQRNYKYGDEMGTLPTPIREGYNFKGWYDEEGKEVTENTKVNGDTTLYASWEATDHTITFDENYNILDGIGTSDGVYTDHSKEAIIENDKITQTALLGDAYFYTPYKFNAIKDNLYRFKVKSDGIWLHSETENSVEAYVMVSSKTVSFTNNDFTRMDSDDFIFPSKQTEEYTLRFDVNKKGNIHSFWDMWISNIEQKNYKYDERMGTLPTPIREGYVFKGWYDEEGKEILENTKVNGDTTLYANWEKN